MKAKKSYGQHFLVREDIAQRIANSLLQTAGYAKVLEIGPGQGMLTKYLLHKPYELIVVEADRDMVGFLQRNFPAIKGQIIYGDFLKTDLHLFFQDAPFAIIGNFPYNISSQILFRLLDHRAQVPELVGMFQKEVAQRVASGPNSKDYGIISVLVQAYYDVELLFEVDKSCFAPPPQVQSAVIRLTRKASQTLGADPKLFKTVVKTAFSQRRKMLRNTMKQLLKNEQLLADAFFNLRPENLSLDDYVRLTNWVAEEREE
jgi:16S rRNA (adenine1518-N6/adenine1519-N6)-dimethyltransferase